MQTTRTLRYAPADRTLETSFSEIRKKKAAAQRATHRDQPSGFGRKTSVKMAVVFGLTTVIPLLVMVYVLHAGLVLRRSMDVRWVSSLALIVLGIALLGGKLMKQDWGKLGETMEVLDRLGKETYPPGETIQLKGADQIDRIPAVVNRLVEIAKEQRDKLRDYDMQVHALDIKVKESHKRLHEVSREDALTGLHNRRYFEDCATHEIARARRYGRTLALAILDIDFFSKYNENAGLPAGNEALCAIARIIRNSLRKTDFPFRYGKNQFVIFFPETGAKEATVAVDRIRIAMEKQPFKGESSQPNGVLTVSAGVSILGKDCETPEQFVSAASEALNKAKSLGRNRVVASS